MIVQRPSELRIGTSHITFKRISPLIRQQRPDEPEQEETVEAQEAEPTDADAQDQQLGAGEAKQSEAEAQEGQEEPATSLDDGSTGGCT